MWHSHRVLTYLCKKHILLKLLATTPIFATGAGGRERNEDAVRVGDGVMVVCDGVGGGPAGDLASSTTADFLYSALDALSALPDNNELDAFTRQIRAFVTRTLVEHPEQAGMATTAAFSLVRNEQLLIGWCGDSRAYVIRDGRAAFKTTDHNMATALIEFGSLTEEQARHDPRRNALLRAVVYSLPPFIAFDYHKTSVLPGDVVVLATDGAYCHFSDAQWVKIWTENSLEEAAEIVKSQALNANDDNYTFCAVKL